VPRSYGSRMSVNFSDPMTRTCFALPPRTAVGGQADAVGEAAHAATRSKAPEPPVPSVEATRPPHRARVGQRAGGDDDEVDVLRVDAGRGERLAAGGHGHLDDRLAVPATPRVTMPLRSRIHSSEESVRPAISWLSSRWAGRWEPRPRIAAAVMRPPPRRRGAGRPGVVTAVTAMPVRLAIPARTPAGRELVRGRAGLHLPGEGLQAQVEAHRPGELPDEAAHQLAAVPEHGAVAVGDDVAHGVLRVGLLDQRAEAVDGGRHGGGVEGAGDVQRPDARPGGGRPGLQRVDRPADDDLAGTLMVATSRPARPARPRRRAAEDGRHGGRAHGRGLRHEGAAARRRGARRRRRSGRRPARARRARRCCGRRPRRTSPARHRAAGQQRHGGEQRLATVRGPDLLAGAVVPSSSRSRPARSDQRCTVARRRGGRARASACPATGSPDRARGGEARPPGCPTALVLRLCGARRSAPALWGPLQRGRGRPSSSASRTTSASAARQVVADDVGELLQAVRTVLACRNSARAVPSTEPPPSR
jgi:hypothetical protein